MPQAFSLICRFALLCLLEEFIKLRWHSFVTFFESALITYHDAWVMASPDVVEGKYRLALLSLCFFASFR